MRIIFVVCTLFVFLDKATVYAQPTLTTYLRSIDRNNPSLLAGLAWVDSCRIAQQKKTTNSKGINHKGHSHYYNSSFHVNMSNKSGLRTTPAAGIVDNNTVLEKLQYAQLRQKIHFIVRKTYIELIYQKKRQREFLDRYSCINQLKWEFASPFRSNQSASSDKALAQLLDLLSLKLAIKNKEITRLTNELIELNGGQPICLSDSIYPFRVTNRLFFDQSKQMNEPDVTRKEWESRYKALQQLVELCSQQLHKQESYSLMKWELKSGMISDADFFSQLINHYQLRDMYMRTERDLQLTVVHLLYPIPGLDALLVDLEFQKKRH